MEIPAIATEMLGAVALAAASSFITVQLSIRRFQSERWWERKAETYERIIEALHHIAAVNRIEMNAMEERRVMSEQVDGQLRARIAPALQEMAKVADIGAFKLSKKAYERIMRYQQETDNAQREGDPYIEADAFQHAAQSCLKDLIEIGRADLGYRSKWWSFG